MIKGWREYFLVVLTVLLSLLLAYFAVVKFANSTPPGDDIYVHLYNASRIQFSGVPSFGSSYPPGFYLVLIGISKLLGISLMRGFVLVAPALIPLAGLSVWLLARRLFGPASALVTLVLFELVSLQPLQTYFDGSLPNLFTTGILLPLLILSVTCWVENRARYIAIPSTFILVGAMVYSHHLSVLVLLATLLVWGTISLLVIILRTKSIVKIVSGLAGMLTIVCLFGLAFFNLKLFSPVRSLVEVFVNFHNTFPFVTFREYAAKEVWSVQLFGVSMGGIIFQAGVAGFLLVIAQCWKMRKREDFSKLLVAAWFFIYWVGATHQWSGEPTRLARDLALPGAILAGWCIYVGWKYLSRQSHLLAYAFVLLVVIASFRTAQNRIQYQTENSPMVRFSSADEQAYTHLKKFGYGQETKVLVREQVWPVVVYARQDEASFPQLAARFSYSASDTSRCYLVGWYHDGVWPLSYADNAIEESYLQQTNLKESWVFRDQLKEWHLLCRTENRENE